MVYMLLAINVFVFAIARLFQKSFMSKPGADPLAFSILFQIVVASLILCVKIVTDGLPTYTGVSTFWFEIFTITLLYAGGNIALLKGLQQIEVSTSSIIMSTMPVWSIIASIIIYGQELTWIDIAGTVLIMSAPIIVFFQSSRPSRAGVLFTLIGSVCFAVATVIDGEVAANTDILSYQTLAFVLPALPIFLYALLSKQFSTDKLIYYLKEPKFYIFNTLYAVAAYTLLSAYATARDAAFIFPIASTQIIVTVLLAALFMGERQNLVRKLVATTLAISGVLILSLT